MIFEYIKANKFFKKYAPKVVDWKKKKTGKNGRGNITDFTDEDKKQIADGLWKLFNDLSPSSAPSETPTTDVCIPTPYHESIAASQ